MDKDLKACQALRAIGVVWQDPSKPVLSLTMINVRNMYSKDNNIAFVLIARGNAGKRRICGG